MVQEVEGCPAKTAISAISEISTKFGEIAVFAEINYDKCERRYKGAQQNYNF